MVALQIDGGCPVKPTSGNTGIPEVNSSDGIATSLLSDTTARAFVTSACAILTALLLRCARSTTVAKDTCAARQPGAASSAAIRSRWSAEFRDVIIDLNSRFPVRI